VFFVLLNYFRIWTWICKNIGANSYGFMPPFSTEEAIEGEKILRNYMRDMSVLAPSDYS